MTSSDRERAAAAASAGASELFTEDPGDGQVVRGVIVRNPRA